MAIPPSCCASATDHDLQPGIAFHAFDHLGNIGDQADTAAACGANIIYISGLGALGYLGLPPESDFATQQRRVTEYLKRAKQRGIHVAIGYICATSIVKLNTFDRNWSEEFRRRFKTAPSEWRQVDRHGQVLKSWYGGDYEPACMSNPDWRAYEKFIVWQQLAAGCDGIFFDNPTVHPDGCFCIHCMHAFEAFLKSSGGSGLARSRNKAKQESAPKPIGSPAADLAALRDYAATHPTEFMQFRSTIARDFFAEMRSYARSIKKNALITANNSLNSPAVLFSQCRRYGYNIYEMSKAEDYVVVEDESSQPRILPNGDTLEYGPTYKQLTAISHGKPVVAVTIADADYHTPPDLVRLAMAEAAANDASYLAWPTWPEAQRKRMIQRIKPQGDFMRQNAGLFASSKARADVIVFLPFRNWLATGDCLPSRLAAALARANIQYEVTCEDQFKPARAKILLANPLDFNDSEQKSVKQFTQSGGVVISTDGSASGEWLSKLKQALRTPSIALDSDKTVRAIVRDQSRRTLVHLLNLNVRKISSFEDKVTPAENIRLQVRVPRRHVRFVRVLTADQPTASQKLEFTTYADNGGLVVNTTLPRLEIASIVTIE